MVKILALLLVSLLVLPGCNSQSDEQFSVITPLGGPTLVDRLDSTIQDTIKAENMPGAIVSIHGNGLNYRRAFGLADTQTQSPLQSVHDPDSSSRSS